MKDHLRITIIQPTGEKHYIKCESFKTLAEGVTIFRDEANQVIAIVPLTWAVLVEYRRYNKAA